MQPTHRLRMATVCLHLSALLYILVGAGVIALVRWLGDEHLEKAETWILLATGILSIGFALVPEIAVWGIHRRKFWGWVLGVILSGLYLPSLFLPLGAFGLWGLLDRGSRAEFGVGTTTARADA